jgi:glycosyltransferase involved in cell wall biosynthesis
MGAREARARRRPYLIEMMGSYTDYELGRKWVRKALARGMYQDRILEKAACIHVNSRQEGEMLRRRGIRTPIACLPVGIDFTETRRVLRETAERGPLRPRPYLLYLGRIHPTKGIDKLLSAWMALGSRAKDFQLVIAGAGEASYVADCQKLSDGLTAAGAWPGDGGGEGSALS